MAIHVALTHKTRYGFDRPVWIGPHTIRLKPAPHCRTPIRDYSLDVTPQPQTFHWQQDPQSNFVARCVFSEPATELLIGVALTAEMVAINPFDFFIEPEAQYFPFAYTPSLARELGPSLECEAQGPLMTAFLAELDRSPVGTIDFLVALNRFVRDRVAYIRRLEPGLQSCEETLRLGSGSCRDSTWLLVQAARHCGIAARFVSGYLIEPVPERCDLHAWADVYLPGAGWVGLDPTSGLLAGEGHVPLACSSDPLSTAPVTGSVAPCTVDFSHEMILRRLAP
ncbi:MAG TPA: transglutaminase family protein [Stellaceae bacterium]|nr:transglutaminase family protein [Stellaceae bacterium]